MELFFPDMEDETGDNAYVEVNPPPGTRRFKLPFLHIPEQTPPHIAGLKPEFDEPVPGFRKGVFDFEKRNHGVFLLIRIAGLQSLKGGSTLS